MTGGYKATQRGDYQATRKVFEHAWIVDTHKVDTSYSSCMTSNQMNTVRMLVKGTATRSVKKQIVLQYDTIIWVIFLINL